MRIPKIMDSSDQSVLFVFNEGIDLESNKIVNGLASELQKLDIPGLFEICPTYGSLNLGYDATVLSRRKLISIVKKLCKKDYSKEEQETWCWKIPVCYGGIYGEDLRETAEYLKITEDELINRHSSVKYRIYMLGFLPGFPYLGGMDEKIQAPRLSSPRVKIPKGSVGIGGKQTGIYPMESPGGWRLIGRTPIPVYKADRENPVLYSAGDYIQFVPITAQEFVKIQDDIEKGNYTIEKFRIKGD